MVKTSFTRLLSVVVLVSFPVLSFIKLFNDAKA